MTDYKQEFIDRIAPHAQKLQDTYGIPASLVIAQAALESGWGRKAVGNNYFGVKATKNNKADAVQVATHEYVNGKKISTTAAFRAYENLADSVANYGKLLAGERYAEVRSAENGLKAADAVQNAGYATDVKYAENLKNIIRQNNLTRFDKKEFQGYEKDEKKFNGFVALLLNILNAIGKLFGMEPLAIASATATETPAQNIPRKTVNASTITRY